MYFTDKNVRASGVTNLSILPKTAGVRIEALRSLKIPVWCSQSRFSSLPFAFFNQEF